MKKNLLISLVFITLFYSNLTGQYSNPLHTTASLNSKTIELGKPVGKIQGSASIESGNATYSIPIPVPPGTNGLAPSVSVNYSSTSGNGHLGVGWGISGLSTITRGGKNLYHNNTVEHLKFDNTDNFYLDGQKLIQVGQTATYTQFVTENETFSTIYNYGSFFWVYTKDGTLMEYGVTNDSRGPNNLFFKLNKIRTPELNYMEFEYYNDDNDYRIKEIRYTGNITTGLQPYNKVSFSYSTNRIDEQIQNEHVPGSNHIELKIKNLLTNITISAENSSFKQFRFTYAHDNISTFLKEIEEVGTDNATSLNKTFFKYGDTPADITAGASSIVLNSNSFFSPGDFDGDGVMEILEVTKAASTVNQNTIYNTSFKVHKRSNDYGGYTTPGATITLPQATFSKTYFKDSYTDKRLYLSNDFNGDGSDDVLVLQRGVSVGETWLTSILIYPSSNDGANFGSPVYLNTPPNGFISPSNNVCYTGDFDGNGAIDIMIIGGNNSNPPTRKPYTVYVYWGTLGSINPNWEIVNFNFSELSNDRLAEANQINVIDFNGDGKQEFHVINGTTSSNYVNDIYGLQRNTSGTIPIKFPISNGPLGVFGNPLMGNSLIYYGDFNGDGKTDMIFKHKSDESNTTWNMGLSTGGRTINSTFTFAAKPSDAANKYFIRTGDFNGDGKTDLLHGVSKETYSDPTSYNIYYSRGKSFYTVYSSHSRGAGPVDDISVFDVNSDGRADIVTKPGQSFQIDLVRFKMDGKERLLEKISDGHKLVSEFQYNKLSSGAPFYTRGPISTSNAIFQNVSLPIYLGSKIIQPNGIGGSNIFNYTYEGLKMHKQGRGVVGFYKINELDNTNNITTTIENEFDATFYVAIPKTITKTLNNPLQTLKVITNTNVVDNLGSKRYFVRTTQISDNSVFENKTNIKTFTYDSFGNITSETSNLNNGFYTTATITDYEAKPNTNNNNILNKPSKINTTVTRQGSSSYNEITKINYNSNGQISSKVNFFEKPKSVSISYGYNSFGNITNTTITPNGNGLVARSASATYDSKGRFVESNTNEEGLITYAVNSILWGKPTATADLAGKTTTYAYDAFGRLTTTSLPQGYNIAQSLGWNGNNGETKITIDHPGKPNKTTTFDILGREIRSEVEGFKRTSTNDDIFTLTTYDSKGNVATTTTPRKNAGETSRTITNEYDPYNRLIKSISSDASFGGTYTNYGAYDSFGRITITTTAPDNTTSSKTIDATGVTYSATDSGGDLYYSYDSKNQLSTVNNQGETRTIINYDEYGRQISLNDMNGAGLTQYEYDALGQLVKETSAKYPSNPTEITYDKLGRIKTKTAVEGLTTYNYYGTNNGGNTGQLQSINNYTGYTQSFSYDAYGRLSQSTEQVDGVNYTNSFTYNTYDDLSVRTFPSGLSIRNDYDNGYLEYIRNNSNNALIYQNTGMNGYGMNTAYTLGNGKNSTIGYFYNMPTAKNTTGVQGLNMVWNYKNGNLLSRNDAIKNKTENFGYDNLDRLTSITGAASQTINYSNNGNISFKTDVGNYSYDGTKKNAVSGVENTSGIIPGQSQTIAYNSFQQPTSISENGFTLNLTYGADENRIKAVLNQNSTEVYRRIYLGDYEVSTAGGTTRQLSYISSPVGLVAIIEGNGAAYHYTYTDHLGSILTVTNQSDSVEFEQSFDAWGRRRNVNSYAPLAATAVPSNLPGWLYIGYTGHEMLDQFGLINMNARLYDPALARVLSPDNFVQMPGSTQGYNRFTYAHNNPLKYSDPDGNNPLIGALIGGAGYFLNAAFSPGGLKANWNWGRFGISVAMGAISGAFAAGIGDAASNMTGIGKVAAFQGAMHGMVAGTSSLFQGGSYGSGFLTGAAGSFMGSAAEGWGPVGRIASSAAFSGAVSKYFGGSFWQGAAQGAIIAGLNHLMHPRLYDVTSLHEYGAAGGMGHDALAFELNNGKQYYVSKDGAENDGAYGPSKKTIGEFDSIADIQNDYSENHNGKRYDIAAVYKATRFQINRGIKMAVAVAKSTYCLIGNSCTDVLSYGLAATYNSPNSLLHKSAIPSVNFFKQQFIHSKNWNYNKILK